MKKFIKLEREAIEQLAKAFQVTPRNVRYALTFQAIGEKSKKIRYAAMKEYEGIYFEQKQIKAEELN